MKLKKIIDLLDNCCNVIYDISDFESIEDLLYRYYVDSNLFTEEELKLIVSINGWSVQTFNKMLSAVYGYKDLEDMLVN